MDVSFNRVIQSWPGGEHEFRLAVGQIRAIEQHCGCSIYLVRDRIEAMQPMADDCALILRFGLEGAGMDPLDAKRLVESMVDLNPPDSFIVPAAWVLQAALSGVKDDPVGEIQAENPKDLSSPQSMPTE